MSDFTPHTTAPGQETIIALSTPPGVAALALIRLSGPDAWALLQPMMDRSHPKWQPSRAYYREIKALDGTILDDVVITYWRAPHSYTGEETIEISCHGNPRIIDTILHDFLARGARLARPGEFTQRAFLNDKLSLTQAEGVLDLLYAPTPRALASAQAMKEGRLGRALQTLREELVDLLSHLEASLDFAEDGIEPQVGAEFSIRIEAVQAHLQQLLRTAPLGRILREGALVVIVGEPNVGKSSLLNALLRQDRAIVAPTPGTTRDLIEAECNIRGLPVRLVDTAGQRHATDLIEAEGVRRALKMMENAQLILHVVEAPHPHETIKIVGPEGVPSLLVANKMDVGMDPFLPSHALKISVQQNLGLEALEKAMEAALLGRSGADATEALTVNARQSATLQRASDALERALLSQHEGFGLEIISLDLRDALLALAEVIGETTNEDILTRLFQNFCIGK